MDEDDSDAEMMKRIAAPMLGGVASALVMVLIVFPVIFSFWRGRGLSREADTESGTTRPGGHRDA